MAITIKSNGLDKCALWVPMICKLLEESIYSDLLIAGKGIAFFGFLFLLIYTLAYNLQDLTIALTGNIVIYALLFVGVCVLIESFHNNSSYFEASKSFFMLAAVPLYASWIMKDKSHTLTLIYAFIFYTTANALNLSLNVSIFEMLSMGDAEKAREYASEQMFYPINSNGIGYLCGTSIFLCAYLLKSYSQTSGWYYLLIALILLFAYSVVCSVSRSALLNVFVIGIVLTLIRYMKPNVYKIAFAIIIITPIMISFEYTEQIYDLLTSRFSTVEIGNEESGDSRSRVYTILLKYLDEVIIAGVGEGNYNGEWGLNSDLAKTVIDEYGGTSQVMIGTHNSIAQIIFYWGIIGLLFYVLLIVQIWRLLIRIARNDPLSVYAYILFISTIVLILFSNNYNYKEFSLIYGIIYGLFLFQKYHTISVKK